MGELRFGVYDNENMDRINEVNAVLMPKLIDAEAAGDEATVKKLRSQILWPAHSLKSFKESRGREFLINRGYNLSEAERYYGKDWLDNE